MRIGILTHNYPLQSFEKKDAGIFIYDFAHALAKKTGKVYIFCPNLIGKKEKYSETPVTWWRWAGEKAKLGSYKLYNPLTWWYFFDFFRQGRRAIAEFIKKNKIDFCLAMWAFPNGVFAWQAKKTLGIPCGLDAGVGYFFVCQISWNQAASAKSFTSRQLGLWWRLRNCPARPKNQRPKVCLPANGDQS